MAVKRRTMRYEQVIAENDTGINVGDILDLADNLRRYTGKWIRADKIYIERSGETITALAVNIAIGEM